jgi:hypothetical protein
LEHKAAEDALEASREQHQQDYELAVAQGDDLKAERERQIMLDNEARAQIARETEITAIWRAQ